MKYSLSLSLILAVTHSVSAVISTINDVPDDVMKIILSKTGNEGSKSFRVLGSRFRDLAIYSLPDGTFTEISKPEKIDIDGYIEHKTACKFNYPVSEIWSSMSTECIKALLALQNRIYPWHKENDVLNTKKSSAFTLTVLRLHGRLEVPDRNLLQNVKTFESLIVEGEFDSDSFKWATNQFRQSLKRLTVGQEIYLDEYEVEKFIFGISLLNLQSLTMENAKIVFSKSAVIHFMNALLKSSSTLNYLLLTSLLTPETGNPRDFLPSLVTILPKLQELRWLKIGPYNMNDKILLSLMHNLASVRLRFLDIQCRTCSIETWGTAFNLLSKLDSLQMLGIGFGDEENEFMLGPNEASNLGACLVRMEKLESLTITGELEITPEFSSSFKYMPSLKELSLESVLFQDPQSIKELMQHLGNVVYLDFSLSYFETPALNQFIETLPQLKQLEMLFMVQCYLTDDEIRALSRQMYQLPKLEYVSFAYNEVVDPKSIHFPTAIKTFSI